MKQVLYGMAIAALSLGFAQTINSANIPISVKKTDPSDTKKVTVMVTDEHNNKVSSITFTKNTDRSTKKLYLNFDKAQINTIKVTYKEGLLSLKAIDPDMKLSIPIMNKDTLAGITLDMDAKSIKDEHKQRNVLEVDQEIIKASLKLPKNTGSWLIISGDTNLSQGAAQSKRGDEMGVLQRGNFKDTGNYRINLYQGKDINIYAQSLKDSKVRQITTLKQEDISNAGAKPILVITADGVARVLKNDSEYRSFLEASIAGSATQSKFTPDTLPVHIDLRALLTSSGDRDYEGAKNQLIKNDKLDQQILTKLMQKKLHEKLVDNLYIFRNLKILSADQKQLKIKPIEALQNRYAEIYPTLQTAHEKIDAGIEDKIKAFRAIITPLLTDLSSAATSSPAGAMAQSSAQQSAKKVTPTTLPAHIDLKSLLLSQDEAAYERSNKRLVNDANVKTLMAKNLDPALIKAPYIANKLKLLGMYDVLLKSKTETINGLQAQYGEVYPILSNSSPIIDTAIEAKIKTLRSEIDKALI